MKDNHSEFTSKPFIQTLEDAVLYAKLASAIGNNNESALIAKTAILHCAFAVEALANNMIQFLNIGSKFSSSIERMDVISKIEFFALVTKKTIDRGSTSMQVISEFIKLRNFYVHPKIKKTKLIQTDNSKYDSEKREYNNLKINEDFQKWTYKDSNYCIGKLVESIDDLLLETIGLEKCSLSCMFLDTMEISGSKGPIVPSRYDDDWASWLASEIGVTPRFYVDHILKRYENAAGNL